MHEPLNALCRADERVEEELRSPASRRHAPHLEGPLVGVDPHVHAEGGVISKLLVANLTAVAGSGFGVAERSLDVGQHVLLQGGVGGKSATAGPHGALERRLARVGHPVEVQALLGHAAVATEVTFNLRKG